MQVDLDSRELSMLRIMLEERITGLMDAGADEAHSANVFRQQLFDKLLNAEKEAGNDLPVNVTVSVDNVETKLIVEKDRSLRVMPTRKNVN